MHVPKLLYDWFAKKCKASEMKQMTYHIITLQQYKKYEHVNDIVALEQTIICSPVPLWCSLI